MKRKNIVIITVLVLIMLSIIGGSLAYWTWFSEQNKSVVFNTAGNVSDYIVYDEGLSYFIGDFQPTDSYCKGVNTTVSFYKTTDAEDIPLRATINMDVNSIGENIANSSDVYWVVTNGDNSIACSEGLSADIVLGSGTFYGKTIGETIKLVSDLEVTTTEQKYTIWIWINSNGTDLGKLSGETVDTNVWTQIDMVDQDYDNDIENNDGYTVIYNVNGGTNGPVNQDKVLGETVTISSTVPTRTGYTFSGWNTNADGSGTSYSAGTSYSTDADLILYAVWTPNTYTISYDANGGSGTTSSTTCTYGKSCTLTSNTFTREEYTFVGWTDSSSGTEVVYKDGYTISIYNQTSNMTLYALWEINTYTISYDANYGTDAPSSQTKTYGTSLTLSEEVPTREKHNFIEWNTASDGSGTSYQPGDTYSVESSVTLYAIWLIKVDAICPTVTAYSGTYDGSAHSVSVTGGSGGTIQYSIDNSTWSEILPTLTDAGTMTTYVKVEGDSAHNSVICGSETVTIEKASITPTVTMTGYTYAGTKSSPSISGNTGNGTVTYYYNTTNSNSGGTAWSNVTSATSLNAGTYYMYATVEETTNYNSATTEAVSFTIAKATNTLSVTAKGGTYSGTALALATASNAQGTVYYSKTTSLTSSNYSSSGSTSIPTGTCTSTSGNSYTVYYYTPGNTNYKAKSGSVKATVTCKTYTVSFNANGGSGAPSAQTKYYGLTLTLSSTKPTRTGYTFLGWSTSSSATSATYSAGGSFTLNESKTLYAVWKIQYADEWVTVQSGQVITITSHTKEQGTCGKKFEIRLTWGQSYNAYQNKSKVFVSNMESRINHDTCAMSTFFGGSALLTSGNVTNGLYINGTLIEPMSYSTGAHSSGWIGNEWTSIGIDTSVGGHAFPWTSSAISNSSVSTVPIRLFLTMTNSDSSHYANFDSTTNVTLRTG